MSVVTILKDTRLAEINNLLVEYANANFDIKIEPSDNEDQIDVIIYGLQMLGEELKRGTFEISDTDARLEEIQQALFSFAKLDFSRNVKISSDLNSLDALALTVNMHGEELKSIYEQIERSKAYTENIITSMLDMLLVINPEGNIITVNQALLDTLGYKEQELIGKPVSVILAKEEFSFKGSGIEELIKKGRIINLEMRYATKSRRTIPVSFSGSVMKSKTGKVDGIVCVAQDITIRKEIEEERIKSAKAERDAEKKRAEQTSVLLREIHHRVKNNLQIITSLLSLQSSFIDDEKTKALFRYSQYRINSMALIHEMLYQTKDISKINYHDYLQKLVSGLITTMKGGENGVKLELDVQDIHLNIDTSIPLGLMINEIVTNSLKYGFKDIEEGILTIHIEKLKYPNFILRIGDNGPGFSSKINFRNTNSLGLKLIHKLVIQLRGNIEKDNSRRGTHYIISFQEIEQTS